MPVPAAAAGTRVWVWSARDWSVHGCTVTPTTHLRPRPPPDATEVAEPTRLTWIVTCDDRARASSGTSGGQLHHFHIFI